MAVFGIPVVHEDDALRATRASVEMRGSLGTLNKELERRWGISLEVRIGVNTGEVVTGDPAGAGVRDRGRHQSRGAPAAGCGPGRDPDRRDDTRPPRRSRHCRGGHAVPGQGEARFCACGPGLTLTSDTPSMITGSPFVGREEESVSFGRPSSAVSRSERAAW